MTLRNKFLIQVILSTTSSRKIDINKTKEYVHHYLFTLYTYITDSSNMMTSAVFSSEVNGFDASNVICAEPSSHYEKMSDILDEESSDMKINNIKEECKTEMTKLNALEGDEEDKDIIEREDISAWLQIKDY